MKRTSQVISAIMTLALGILFVILKNEVIGIAMTVLGVALVILGVIDLIKLRLISGIIKILLAVAVFVIGGLLIDVAVIVLAVVLLIYGIMTLVKRITEKKKGRGALAVILGFIEPVICIIGSVFLLTGGSGKAISWAIIVAGVLLIIDGIIGIIAACASKN